VVAAPLGEPEYNTLGFKKVENDDPRELWRVQFKKNRRPERGTDLDLYQRGEITITPLRMGATAVDLLETLESWELEAKRGL
jgi:broad specificity polyphosphatase/5'/3'-nucleotidase SurE